MKKGTAAAGILAGLALILDSRCAADSARDALALCAHTLVPSLFPLFVISGMLVPGLLGFRLPWLSRLLGLPRGAEGIWLLGAAGGFPVGAAAIAQAVQTEALSKKDGTRMLGLCSLCGPAFLFGVLPRFLPMDQVTAIFLLQWETSLLLAAFWPGRSEGTLSPVAGSVSLPESVQRAVSSMLTVCSWVVLAGVAAGFLRRWLFPFLPGPFGTVLTGLMELTTGIFALPEQNRFLLTALFVCFGGASVLLQIGGVSALPMGTCVLQKAIHGLLGLVAAWLYLRIGAAAFLFVLLPVFLKIMVEIHGGLVYNGRERKGSECCFVRKWSAPANTAASARK